MARQKPRPAWNDDAFNTLARIIGNAMRKTEKKANQARRAATKAQEQMTKQGKPAMVEATKKLMKTENAARATRAADRLKYENEMAKRELMKRLKGGRGAANVATMAEAAGSKGTVIRRGKEVPVSKAKAAELATQAKRATAQSKKGNEAKRRVQRELLENAKTLRKAGKTKEAARLKARYDAHVKKYGRYS